MATQDQTTTTVSLKEGIGRNSGRPYTALSIVVVNEGKTWQNLMFPTNFEADYVIDHFGDNKPATLTLNQEDKIIVTAGDFQRELSIDSLLETKFVKNAIKKVQQQTAVETELEDKLNLEDEDADKSGFLG